MLIIGMLMLLLGAYFVAAGFYPPWAGRWRWGRSSRARAISPFGFVSIGATLGIVGIAFIGKYFGRIIGDQHWGIWAMIGFLCIILSAARDSLRG